MTIRPTQRPGPRSVAAMVGLAFVVGCAEQKAAQKPAFSYDPAEFLGAKPWTDLAESQALAAFAFAEGLGAALRE